MRIWPFLSIYSSLVSFEIISDNDRPLLSKISIKFLESNGTTRVGVKELIRLLFIADTEFALGDLGDLRILPCYVRERASLVEILKRLTPEQWHKTAVHEAFDHYSVFIMFRHLYVHEMLHSYRIEELLLKKDWDE